MSKQYSEDKAITIEDLFAGFSLKRFIDEYLYWRPFTLPYVCRPVCPWGSSETLQPMLEAPDADVILVRSNERYSGPQPQKFAKAIALSQQGYTILIRHAERHHAGISQLASQFSTTFRGEVDAHIYLTPPNQYGFAWHYDAEDVFILQLAGEKGYALRKNTVNPWPLEETLPVDMQYEREIMPLMRVTLHAGDLLYIPCGYWHRAIAADELAISLAIGVMSRSALDAFDLLRPELLDSILWRQRLPAVSTSTDDEEASAYHAVLDLLAADLAQRVASPAFRKKLEEFRPSSSR